MSFGDRGWSNDLGWSSHRQRSAPGSHAITEEPEWVSDCIGGFSMPKTVVGLFEYLGLIDRIIR
jgi:hypothetical protein